MPRGNTRQKRNSKIAREQPGVHKLNGDIYEARERIAELEAALDEVHGASYRLDAGTMAVPVGAWDNAMRAIKSKD